MSCDHRWERGSTCLLCGRDSREQEAEDRVLGITPKPIPGADLAPKTGDLEIAPSDVAQLRADLAAARERIKGAMAEAYEALDAARKANERVGEAFGYREVALKERDEARALYQASVHTDQPAFQVLREQRDEARAQVAERDARIAQLESAIFTETAALVQMGAVPGIKREVLERDRVVTLAVRLADTARAALSKKEPRLFKAARELPSVMVSQTPTTTDEEPQV